AMTPQGMPVASGGSNVAMPMQGAASGPYYPGSDVHLKKKSNLGLVIGLLVVLAAGGGIAAFVVLGSKDNKGGGDGSGSADVASVEFDGKALTAKMCACKDLACGDAVQAEWNKGYNPDSPHKWSTVDFDQCYRALQQAKHGSDSSAGSDHSAGS